VVVRILITGVVAVAALGAVLTACSTQLTVSKDALQKDISDRLTKAGEPPQSVSCHDDLIGEVGKTTRCEVVMSATNSFEPVVTVTGVNGATVNYDMKPALTKEQLQKSVSGLVEQAANVPVESVDCGSGLDGKEGAEAFCWVDAGGVKLRRTVEVKSVQGLTIDYNLVPVLVKTEIESSLLDQLQQQLGRRPDSASCTDNLEGRTGTSIDCNVVSGGDSKTFAVTVTGVDGSKINYSYEPKT
jgi:hypothetical protein